MKSSILWCVYYVVVVGTAVAVVTAKPPDLPIGPLDLVTFDGAKATTYKWETINDPVMGGVSDSEFTANYTSDTALWEGHVRIVPKLKAPGFCEVRSGSWWTPFQKFGDVSRYTHLEVRYRSTIPYTGFKISMSADTLVPSFHSFKANFDTGVSDGEWHTAAVPFSAFSSDWSAYTGDCDTTDPDGSRHYCCSVKHPESCLTLKNLMDINQIGFWAEGHEGKFHIELEWVRGGFGDTCTKSEYCCPESHMCLKSTSKRCSGMKDCAYDEACSSVTGFCGKISHGARCTSSCADGSHAYCSAEAGKAGACWAPTHPGHLCDSDADCAKHHADYHGGCSSAPVCCPITKTCVAKSTEGGSCTVGEEAVAPWWPLPVGDEHHHHHHHHHHHPRARDATPPYVGATQKPAAAEDR